MLTGASMADTFEDALWELGFISTDRVNYGAGDFVTYRRARDMVAVHFAPDGLFAVFDRSDGLIGEGKSAAELRLILSAKATAGVVRTPRGRKNKMPPPQVTAAAS
jgi:hypothetical protein